MNKPSPCCVGTHGIYKQLNLPCILWVLRDPSASNSGGHTDHLGGTAHFVTASGFKISDSHARLTAELEKVGVIFWAMSALMILALGNE